MDAALHIRAALQTVSSIRQATQAQPALALALRQIKQLQAQRFAGSYADLLQQPTYQCSARFFLQELYADRDFSQRDAQFARIAGALQRLFTPEVIATAQTLAELHRLTETLDAAMAQLWLQDRAELTPAWRYLNAWRQVGSRAQRLEQLDRVLQIGCALRRHTQTPGLRLLLKMMRLPAAAAGLGQLQGFLEAGFDTFAEMGRTPTATATFLATIAQRERHWITQFFDAESAACAAELSAILEAAPAPIQASAPIDPSAHE